tara:strand:- start:1677 stop:1946 length:270 start_codon:yes stop_codon:yes gene_type:complete
MSLFKSLSELAMFAFVLALFFLIFGQMLGSLANVVIANSPETIGGSATSDLVGNTLKSVLLWVPLVGMGFAIYLAVSRILEKEKGAGRF